MGWSEDLDRALKVPSNTRVYTIAKVCTNSLQEGKGRETYIVKLGR